MNTKAEQNVQDPKQNIIWFDGEVCTVIILFKEFVVVIILLSCLPCTS